MEVKLEQWPRTITTRVPRLSSWAPFFVVCSVECGERGGCNLVPHVEYLNRAQLCCAAFGDGLIFNLTAEIHALRLARQLMPITATTRQRHGKCLQITCFNPRAVMGHHIRSPPTSNFCTVCSDRPCRSSVYKARPPRHAPQSHTDVGSSGSECFRRSKILRGEG
eukprot:scaffold109073_cov70-Cyclotella_meneghiniana.AAC.1